MSGAVFFEPFEAPLGLGQFELNYGSAANRLRAAHRSCPGRSDSLCKWPLHHAGTGSGEHQREDPVDLLMYERLDSWHLPAVSTCYSIAPHALVRPRSEECYDLEGKGQQD